MQKTLCTGALAGGAMAFNYDDSEIRVRTETLTAQKMNEIESMVLKNRYCNYLFNKIKEIGDIAQDEIGIDLSHSGIHYYYWDKNRDERAIYSRPVYFNPKEQAIKVWNKLKRGDIDPNKYHIAQILLDRDYIGKTLIQISLGGEEKNDGTIYVPENHAVTLQAWLRDKLTKCNYLDIQTELTNLSRENENLRNYLIKTGAKIDNILSQHSFKDPSNTLKLLLISLHLSLLTYECGKSYKAFFQRIEDHQYVLGSFAGRIGTLAFKMEKLNDIQSFSRVVLSYITYWEGIVAFERKRNADYKRLNNKKIKFIKTIYDDYLDSLLFVDPDGEIKKNSPRAKSGTSARANLNSS